MKATISGSMRRFLPQMAADAAALQAGGVRVLSPRSFELAGEPEPGFVVVAGDEGSTEEIQQRHLDAIAESDVLWLVCPGGYIGASGLFEIGFATGRGVPVYAAEPPAEPVLRPYVRVGSLAELSRRRCRTQLAARRVARRLCRLLPRLR